MSAARLMIYGDRDYIKKMFFHLRKEHPSTKKKMFVIGIDKRRLR